MKHAIQTVSGIWMDPSSAKEEEISLADIAHSLSLICRYNGHCREFYSVAQHSVLVADLLRDLGHGPRVQLLGLMHDAHEAYLGDMPSPLKKLFREYGPLSDALQAKIDAKYDTTPTEDERKIVKNADFWCFRAEVRDIMPAQSGWTWPDGTYEWNRLIEPVSSKEAKRLFLDRYEALTKKASDAEE